MVIAMATTTREVTNLHVQFLVKQDSGKIERLNFGILNTRVELTYIHHAGYCSVRRVSRLTSDRDPSFFNILNREIILKLRSYNLSHQQN